MLMCGFDTGAVSCNTLEQILALAVLVTSGKIEQTSKRRYVDEYQGETYPGNMTGKQGQ